MTTRPLVLKVSELKLSSMVAKVSVRVYSGRPCVLALSGPKLRLEMGSRLAVGFGV